MTKIIRCYESQNVLTTPEATRNEWHIENTDSVNSLTLGRCSSNLTHCGLVTPYGDGDLGQNSLR